MYQERLHVAGLKQEWSFLAKFLGENGATWSNLQHPPNIQFPVEVHFFKTGGMGFKLVGNAAIQENKEIVTSLQWTCHWTVG